MTISELALKWDSIDPIKKGFLLVSGNHPVSFHIGYHSGDLKSFAVLSAENIFNVRSSRAITTESIEVANNQFILKFKLNFESLDEIFVKLCWDLIESSRNVEDPLLKIVEQFEKWMDLLQKAPEDIMSTTQQKGLLGELLFMKHKMENKNPKVILESWVGPEGSDQDFNFDSHWAEVKATPIDSNSIKISSLQQLDRVDEGLLVVVFADRTTSTGNRVVELNVLIDEIRDKLVDQIQIDIFNCKLAKYGYLECHREKYADSKYHFSRITKYLVDSKFPKLSRQNVPNSILNLQYELCLNSIDYYVVKGDYL